MNPRFQALVDSLPSLARAPGANPWDAERFHAWLCQGGLSSGEVLAAQLVLGIWNAHTDWVQEARERKYPFPEAARRFDLIEAAAVFDSAHLAALRRWLERPEFP